MSDMTLWSVPGSFSRSAVIAASARVAASAPRVASDQVEFGLDYVDTQTQDELAPERPDCPAPEPQLPPFELVPVEVAQRTAVKRVPRFLSDAEIDELNAVAEDVRGGAVHSSM